MDNLGITFPIDSSLWIDIQKKADFIHRLSTGYPHTRIYIHSLWISFPHFLWKTYMAWNFLRILKNRSQKPPFCPFFFVKNEKKLWNIACLLTNISTVIDGVKKYVEKLSTMIVDNFSRMCLNMYVHVDSVDKFSTYFVDKSPSYIYLCVYCIFCEVCG